MARNSFNFRRVLIAELVAGVCLGLTAQSTLAGPGFAPAVVQPADPTFPAIPLTNTAGNPLGMPTFYANSPAGVRTKAVYDTNGKDVGTNVNTGTPIRKFVDELPNLGAIGTALGVTSGTGLNGVYPSNGRRIPIAVAGKWVAPSADGNPANGVPTGDDYYEIAVIEFTEQLHSDFSHPTVLRGYVQIETAALKAAGKSKSIPLFYLGVDNQPDPKRPIMIQATNADGTLQFDTAGKPVKVPAFAVDEPHFLGPAIVATRDIPTRVKFLNLLPVGRAVKNMTDGNGKTGLVRNGDLFLPVDETLTGAGFGPDGKTRYTQNRTSVHLHGGDNPWISDGTPYQWIAPADETDPTFVDPVTKQPSVAKLATDAATAALLPAPDTSVYSRGVSALNVPDMADPGPGAQTLYYPNGQSSRLIWYHDHTVGLTRVNVYGGMAAPYVLIDPKDAALTGTPLDPVNHPGLTIDSLQGTPGVGIPLVIQDHTFVPDDWALQDAKWDASGRWGKTGGDFWFPHVYETNASSQVPAALTAAGTALDPTGTVANPAGRWDYGPELGLTNFALTMPPDGTNTTDPRTGVSNVSTTPESFMDTAMVNGVVYPKVTVNPEPTRFRILDATNDRYVNLSWYLADGSAAATGTSQDPTRPVATNTEIKMISADPLVMTLPVCAADPVTGLLAINPVTGLPAGAGTTCLPATWPTDARVAGNPDPATAGPQWIELGNEGGFLPTPRIVPATPVTFGADITALGDGTVEKNVTTHGLMISPGMRVDVVTDFSQYACKTLILYNDSPAPTPGTDDRYDYYTGNPDARFMGGADSTLPGYGPNTRTLLQVNVGAPVNGGAICDGGVLKKADQNGILTPTTLPAPLDPHAFDSVVAQLYAARNQPPIVDVAGAVAQLQGKTKAHGPHGKDAILDATGALLTAGTPAKQSQTTTEAGELSLLAAAPVLDLDPLSADYHKQKKSAGSVGSFTTAAVEDKAIVEDFDPNFGRLNALFGAVSSSGPLGQAYADAPVDYLAANTVSIWRITHQGIDTHPLHFHLTNVQVLARVQPDGTVIPPLEEEAGWREIVNSNPAEDLIVALKPDTPKLNGFGLPRSARTLDPAQAVGVKTGFTQVDPISGAAATVVNTANVDFNWEYVWHCHILGHEENDFMRSLSFDPLDSAAKAPTFSVSPALPVTISFTDNASNEYAYQVQRQEVDAANTPLAGSVTSTTTLPARTGTGVTVKVADTTAAAGHRYQYQVIAKGGVQDGVALAQFFGVSDLKAASSLTASASLTAPQVTLSWVNNAVANTGYTVERCLGANTAAACAAPGASFASFGAQPAAALGYTDTSTTLAAGTTFTYRVTPTGEAGTSGVASLVEVTTGAAPGVPASVTAAAPIISAAGAGAATVGNLTLTWPAAPNAVSYSIAQTADAGLTWTTLVASQLATAAATTESFAVTGLVPGASYQFRVAAKNGYGSSAAVASAAVAVPAQLLAPTLTAAATTAGVQLTWVDNSIGETYYQVDRCAGTAATCGLATAPWTTLSATIAPSAVGYLDASAVAATAYVYRVRAIAGTVNGAYSALVAVTAAANIAAPSNLVASSTTGSNVVLTWIDNSTNESSFSVSRATVTAGVTGAFAALGTVARTGAVVASTGTSVTYTDATAVVGSTYVYQVAAVNATTLTTSAPSTSAPITLAMSAPTALTTNAASGTAIALSWTDTSANESGFEVQRSSDGVTWTALGATQPTVARTAAQATSVNTAVTYSDATALVNVAYTYRVRSVNATAVLQSAWTVSAPAILTVAAPTTLTAALGVATKTTQPVALSWIDNANNETAYQVQRAPVTAGVVGTYAVVGTVTRTAAQKTAIAAAVAYTDATGLINTTYAYQVVAVSGTALSQPSNVAQVTTSGAATTTSAPGTLTANTASGVSIALSWIDNSTTETGFNVMRSTDNVTFTQVGATLTRTAAQTKATGTATTYTDTTAAIGTTYYYRVDAVIPVAATATTAAGTTTVPSSVITAALAIAAPTTVSATVPAGTGNVLVSWTDTSNNESGFEVDRIDPLGAKVTFAVARTAAQKTSVNTVVSYTDTTALPGTSYTYVVRAVNLTGTVRAVSADVTAAPVPVPTPPMIAPTSVSAVVASASSIKLSWIDMSTNETGFLVERSTDNGVTWGKLASLAAARTAAQGKAVNAAVSYTDTLVAPVVQGTYVYRVSAVQHTGTGATAVITAQSAATQGNPVSFIAPAAPTLLTAAAGTTAGTVNLAWTVNSTNETGFTVQYSTTATFTAPVTVAIASPAVSSVTVSGLTSKTGYFFRIAAKNLVGTSAYASTTVAVVAP